VVFDPRRLAEAHSRPSPVLVDELDAGRSTARLEKDSGGSTVALKRYFRRERRGLRNRTPSPVPFSSMNSIPLASSAARIFLTVSPRPPNSPSVDSSLAAVGCEMPEAVLGRSRRSSTYVRYHDLACLLVCSCPDLDLDLTPQRRQKAHQPFKRHLRELAPKNLR
jgi:hypothetical protein